MGNDSDAEKELLDATDVDTSDSEWEYEEEIADSNSCNFYNEEQSMEINEICSGAMDTDEEFYDCPVIDNPTPMMMIQNVSQFRSDPVRGRQSGVRVCGGQARGGCIRVRVCGGVNARGIHGSRVRGRRGAALGVRMPQHNTQTRWKEHPKVLFDPDKEIPDPFPFNENVGLKCCMNENASVLDYLQLYLTDNIFDVVTVLLSSLCRTIQLMQITHIGLWVPVTHNEMKKFIGSVLLMGIIYKPTIPFYWSTDEMFVTPIFSLESCLISINFKVSSF